MTVRRPKSQLAPRRWVFFIGPDKAGSTWIHNALAAHPAVAVPAAKDLFFFNRFHDRGIEWYLRHFKVDRSTDICAEVCHDYLFDRAAPSRIRAFAPAATLIVCARHPVDRAVSAYMYMRRQGRLTVPFSEAIRLVEELIDHGRYTKHLMPWLEHFPQSQIAILDFDLLWADPPAFASSLYAAIGAADRELPATLQQPARPATVARWQPAATFGKRAATSLRRWRGEAVVGYLKASAFVERALFRSAEASDKPSPTDRDRAFMRAQLEPDSRRLDAIFGTDYASRWWRSHTWHS